MGFGKDGKGAIVKEQLAFTLGALAGQAPQLANSSVILDSDFRILKSIVTGVITGLTGSEGNGLLLYLTQGDLSVGEVEANIELNGPLRMGDREPMEVSERWVRLLGAINVAASATEIMFRNENNGPILKINPRWTFRRGRTGTEGGWNWVVYNDGVSITTGSTCRILATHYGVWVN